MQDYTLLILSSRADAYARVVREALRDLPLLATDDPVQARAEGAG